MRPSGCCLLALLLTIACGRVADWDRTAADAAAAPLAPASMLPAHLRVSGTAFVTADGKPLAWRGISAFRLLEMLSQGADAEAAAYLDWASTNHLTVVRVLTMARHLFKLEPPQGVAALPRLLQMAAARKLYVEVVALADTAEIAVDLDEHLKAIGAITERYPNALVELANEPVHPTQRLEVHSPERLRKLRSLLPQSVPVSLGSIEADQGFAAGDYVTWHVPRANDPPGWGHVLAIGDGAALVDKWKKPVVSDEPIGAAPVFEAGRRDNDPARFRAAALVTRLAGLGATFHYEGGLQAQIPTGREIECFNAWNEGLRLLPDAIEQRGSFGRAGEQESVAVGFERGAAAAVYERRTERDAWIVVVGVTGDPAVRVAPGWRVTDTQRFPGVQVLIVRRS